MQRFELKDSPCTRCRRDESGHEMNWKNRDKTQRSGLGEERTSKGAGGALPGRAKRSRADFARTRASFAGGQAGCKKRERSA